MPSIPQSLLWISLVVLWLFVLVPMLISKRDAVRRTSDVALATRVLNGGASARLLKRGGPAAGHRSDPDWRHEDGGYDGEHEDSDDDVDEDESSGTGSVVVAAAAAGEQVEPYLDVDIVEEDFGGAAIGAGAESAEPSAVTDNASAPGLDGEPHVGDPEDSLEPECSADDVDEASAVETQADPDAGEYEYVEDSAGLEAGADPSATAPPFAVPAASRRRRYDSKTATAVTARKYNFRKRVLMAMALVLAVSAAAAFTVAPAAWWVCGTTAGVMMLYLAYLRRQTRIEEQVRARRMQRMRSRFGVEDTADPEFDVVPTRLRRPGAAVLDIDDEDPLFEHLEYAPFARDNDWRHNLPRAAGQ
jgi:hypothetical protein